MSSSVTDDDALAVLGILLVLKNQKKRKVREEWCKQWLLKRKQFTHINLLKELQPYEYRNYIRMNEETYMKLLSLVTPLIEKQDTVMRNAISAHERLIVTLRFLATGRSYECLKFSAIISPQSLGRIIPETCAAIFKVLKKDYIPFPDTSAKWKQIANLFEERWNFPHCLGAIDGKHIDIIPPANSGSFYYNYKGRHSMVLMAVVDARYRFILADFGTNGRISDGGVLQNTKFFEKLQNNTLNIPNPENIGSNSRCLPYVFVADDAFPLRTDMLKPYRQADLDNHDKRIFNYKLSRARRIVENAFGILTSRFRIYRTQINIAPNNIEKVVMATIALHNYLMEHVPQSYAPPRCFYRENINNGTVVNSGYDTTSSTMENLERRNQGHLYNNAKIVRQEYQNFFVNEGKVSWQDNFV